MVAIRNSALTILLHARTRRHQLIPHRAAAIQLRRVPTPHPAAATAAVVGARTAVVAAEAGVIAAVVALTVEAEAIAAVVVLTVEAEARTAVEVAEVHTAVEAPARTAGSKSFPNAKARPNVPDGLFVFLNRRKVSKFFAPLLLFRITPRMTPHNSSCLLVLNRVKDFVSGICCFDMGNLCGRCSLTMKCYCFK